VHKATPHLKTNQCEEDWQSGLSNRVPA
jgi:hypothetical protein